MLRAQGRLDDADEIAHGELARALAVARLSAPDTVDEAALLASEEERVANAAVLAELLVPLLAPHLTPASHNRPAAEAVAAAPTAPRAPEPVRSEPAGVPPIADLIDGMLSQERARPLPRR